MEPAQKAEVRRAISKVKHIIAFILELNWFLSASAALLLFILLKKYLFDVARINSNDMNNTYLYGDAVIISRNMPDPATGDVIQFVYPLKDSLVPGARMIQRVYGLPGDTLEIREKVIYLNGMALVDTGTVLHNYFVRAKQSLDSNFRRKYGLWEGGEISNKGDYSFSLTNAQRAELGNDSLIKNIELKAEKKGNWDEAIFPGSRFYRWNLDHYGPLYIPGQNDTLQLDTVNLALYSTLISQFEKNKLEKRSDSIFINGKHSTSYVVKKNYYFVLGDNRDNAVDSRTWGFLPDNYLSGKVIWVLNREDR